MPAQSVDAQQKVNNYFESSSQYWRNIYFDSTLLPVIYQDRHNTTLRWIRELGLPAEARILEAGCGAGFVSIELARDGYTVDALDATDAMLQLTRRNAEDHGVEDRIRLHAGDVHRASFRPQTFDLIVAVGLIPWLHSAADALHQMYRTLKPGGHLLITVDNNARLNRILDPLSSPALTPLRAVAKHALRLCGAWAPDPGFQPKRHYPREVHRLIQSCNFQKMKTCSIGFGPFTFLGREILSDTFAVGLHRRFQGLAQKNWPILRWTGSHYLILARKPSE